MWHAWEIRKRRKAKTKSLLEDQASDGKIPLRYTLRDCGSRM
jgi:hypothetical protein